jgi:hypothetical protein
MSRIPTEALLAQLCAAVGREQSTSAMGYCDDVRDIIDEMAARVARDNPSRAYLRTRAIDASVKLMRFALDMSE